MAPLNRALGAAHEANAMSGTRLPEMFAFFVPGRIYAHARTQLNLGNGSKQSAFFTRKPQRMYRNIIQAQALASFKTAIPLTGPVDLSIRATYPYPVSWSQKAKDSTFWKTSKPDADNVAKMVKDALKGIAYVDDAQVTQLTVQKVYGVVEGLSVVVQTAQVMG